MDITYCSHVDCINIDCSRHQSNVPRAKTYSDISIADLNDGYCFDARIIPSQLTPKDMEDKINKEGRAKLLYALCEGTQKTNYRCNDVCKALCGVDGSCPYCATLADSIEEVFNYAK